MGWRDIENLREVHSAGLRLLQLVHFRANELGHIQTYPYSPGGLTRFGREVVAECNRVVSVDILFKLIEPPVKYKAFSLRVVIPCVCFRQGHACECDDPMIFWDSRWYYCLFSWWVVSSLC